MSSLVAAKRQGYAQPSNKTGRVVNHSLLCDPEPQLAAWLAPQNPSALKPPSYDTCKRSWRLHQTDRSLGARPLAMPFAVNEMEGQALVHLDLRNL